MTAVRTMAREWAQFRLLLRHGSARLMDSEALAPGGDSSRSAANVLGVLAALGLSLALYLMYKYEFYVPRAGPVPFEGVTWPDKQYLIAAAMLASGFVLVMAWDALFPDRRDAMVLCPLPLRMRTLFAARVAALAWMLVAVVLASNFATFIAFPTYMMKAEAPGIGWFAYFFLHVRIIFAAAAFAFLALLALEGMLINLLPYRVFRRISAWVQLGLLFLLLFVYVLEPSATPEVMTDPGNALMVRLLPPFWFTGLYLEALGSTLPVVKELAALARAGTLAAALLALLMYALGYRRAVRKAVEESDAAPPARNGRRRQVAAAALRRMGGAGIGGAAFRFVTLTLVRHPRNRLILAAYLSLALGYALGDAAQLVRDGGRALYSPSAGMAALSLVVAFFILLGMRVLFAMPVDLKANWVFQVTEAGRFSDYHGAVRRVLLWIGAAPVCLVALPGHAFLWGWRNAVLHTMVLALVCLLLIEVMLRGFEKIPFTCSFLPGKSNLKTRLPVAALAFSGTTAVITTIEVYMLLMPALFAFVYGLGLAALALLWVDRRRYERAQLRIVYEESNEIVLRLGLQG